MHPVVLCYKLFNWGGGGGKLKEEIIIIFWFVLSGFLLAQCYSVYLLIQQQMPLDNTSQGLAMGRQGGDPKCCSESSWSWEVPCCMGFSRYARLEKSLKLRVY